MRTLLSIFALMIFGLTAQAEIHSEDVKYQIDGEEFTGYLAYDDAVTGKRPGVLVVHQWWGLSDQEKRRARMLAELGYVAFAVDMYGTGKLTDKSEQAKSWMQAVTTDVEWWRERAMKGVEILGGNKHVDREKLAAIGYCFGGGTVIQMAYGGADVQGVVSFHGSLPVADEKDISNIKTKMLVLHGNDDPFVPEEIAAQFRKKLEAGDVDWQMIIYGGVRHSFTMPDTGKYGMEALKYDADADRRSWGAMRTFLHEIFAN